MAIEYYYNPIPLSGAVITAFAFEQADAAQNYLVKLGDAVGDLQPPTIEAIFPEVDSAPMPLTTEVPEMAEVVWSIPPVPAAFTGVLDVGDYLPEPFDADPPSLVYGSPPDLVTDTLPTAPGINLVFDDPILDITLPAAPDLLSLNIRPFDGITIPTIDFTIPELTAVAPSIREYVPGDDYTSGLLTALQTTLQDRIENGGTGLNPDVEQALWDRARERELRQQADTLMALEQIEALGYTAPPGFYLDARLKVLTETNYTIDGLSREIMIKQAELELENVIRSLDMASSLEGRLIEYSNQVEQRLFEATRYATEAGISIYNANVQAYIAYVDAYKAKVAIYEAQVRGELARVEAYRAEISAEQAKADVNMAIVRQYEVQVQAALANIEVFKAEIQSIQSKAEIEKLKVMIFGEQVKGYTAQINAYTAGVEGFKATVQAEVTKQDAFKSQVQAYTAQVEAGTKQIQARIEEYLGRLEAKKVEWEGYKAIASAESSRAQAIAAGNRSLADTYSAEVSAISAYNDATTKQWQASLDQAQRVTEIGISAAKANAELYVTTRSLAMDAAKVGAQVSAQLGASALAALSLSNSYSVSNSAQASTSDSSSTSYSEAHNYNYSV